MPASHPLFELDSRFSHMPRRQPWNPVVNPGRNVMALWPDEWDTEADNRMWSGALRFEAVCGARWKALPETGYHDFTLSYAFNALFDDVPSRSEGHTLYFDCQKVQHSEVKLRNFIAALTFIKHYPTCSQMANVLHISDWLFYQQVMPAIYSMAGDAGYLLDGGRHRLHGSQAALLGVQPLRALPRARDGHG